MARDGPGIVHHEAPEGEGGNLRDSAGTDHKRVSPPGNGAVARQQQGSGRPCPKEMRVPERRLRASPAPSRLPAP